MVKLLRTFAHHVLRLSKWLDDMETHKRQREYGTPRKGWLAERKEEDRSDA